ncbi:MAG TPA: 30S ribosomal protein S8 [Thermoplasmata archaeon]|nr:30S ribosomal protein S8 [Thermoplasmata archaeon]
MAQEPLANALSSIKNAAHAGKIEVEIRPASKLIDGVLKLIKESKYIGSYERIEDGKGGKFKIKLVGNLNDCGVIKPRHPIKYREFERWESRFLPARDFGLLILTTNKGVVDQQKAKELGIGGRLLAYVY